MPVRPIPQDSSQQHDLLPAVAERIVRQVHVRRDESVLEVGAGNGALTAPLLSAGATVHAVERDVSRCTELIRRFADEIRRGRIQVVCSDVRRHRFRPQGRWRIVSNPPFSLTSELVRTWLLDPHGDQPHALDLVLQTEAARKLCGRDGAHTRSSVLMRLFGKPWVSLMLQRRDVVPAARVDLCVFSLRRVPSAPDAVELARIDRLLEIAFAGPHTVPQALRGVATGVQLRRQASEHGWSVDAHPRELKPSAWRNLATLLATCGRI